MTSYLTNMARYNQWVNRRLFDKVQLLPDEDIAGFSKTRTVTCWKSSQPITSSIEIIQVAGCASYAASRS